MPEPAGELSSRLKQHVELLAGAVGERHPGCHERLEQAREYVEEAFSGFGYTIERERYKCGGREYGNVVATRPGAGSSPFLVVGAHYDTAPGTGTPGADDNASGVAALLELAGTLADKPAAASIRWVAFTLEEPPHFQTASMGSRVHARRCRERGDSIRGMIALEMVGYYCDEPGCQLLPLPEMQGLYPEVGNFIAVAGNEPSAELVGRLAGLLREHGELPVEDIAPDSVPGVDLSDHSSFWQEGYEALMVTDTAFFRNPHYHLPSDRPETLDYRRMALLVEGLAKALVRL